MGEPRRIQRQRTKGWRMPEGAVYVGRPTRWGNPFVPDCWIAVGLGYRGDAAGRREAAVALFRSWMTDEAIPDGGQVENGSVLEFSDGTTRTVGQQVQNFARLIARPQLVPAERPELSPLRGRDLVCWCPLVDDRGDRVPCHADVLLDLLRSAGDGGE